MGQSGDWMPSPELRTRIKQTATDLTEARDIPPERFPGHKGTYCANLEGWLGGFTVALLGALERVEAERDRYREALRVIAGYGPHNPPDYFDRDDMRQIARGALDA